MFKLELSRLTFDAWMLSHNYVARRSASKQASKFDFSIAVAKRAGRSS